MEDPEFPGEEQEAAFHPAPSWMERGCMVICEIGIVAMAVIVLVEIITRNLFGFSFEASEELGGYIIVGISFLSLPVCQVYRSYHHVQFVQSRLSPRVRAASHVLFDVLSLGFCLLLVWQLTRFVLQSYRSEDVAMTLLATPLWIPQALMPIGALAASVSLLRALIGNVRKFLGGALMELAFQLIFSFGVFLLLLAAGMAVPFAIAVPGVLYLLMQHGVTELKGIGLVTWGSMNSFTLTAIPLFILMAEMMQRSGLSFRIYRGLAKVVSRLPGGLLQTNIVGCALFASISGSSVATAASIGGVALPQLIQRNYDRRLSAGSLAAGGTLGILLPPSIAMIIYGSFTETSVAKLFMAGVIPGVMLMLMFMIYIGVRSFWGNVVPRRAAVDQTSVLGAAADIVPFALLIGGIMGSIYAGWATPTEAASGGCAFALILCLIWGDLNWACFVDAMHRTVQVVGNLMFIIYSAYIYAYAIGVAGVGEHVTSWLVGLHLSHFQFFGALFVLYTVLGCLVESIGMIVITVPLIYPVLGNYGIDPIWFGVILVMYVELGQISPPIGINLFVIQSIWDGELSDVVMGTIPFHIIMFVLLFLLTAFPALALWLPGKM